jgi:flagellar biosynthesis activator protein FlaF
MSVAAYQQANLQSESPKQTEYRIFALFTRALEEAEQKGPQEVVKAVADNRQLWITLQMDLADEGNGLPVELKAQLLSLAIWVNRYSPEAMKGNVPLQPLINVNRDIMEGLRGPVPEKQAEPQQTQATGIATEI